jgi:diacylglycerol kinase (ATP)
VRVSLVHNPTAGDENHSGEELVTMLGKAGYDAAHYTTEKEDLARLADDPQELVVAAGGDGTVRKVATCLIGRGVPIAILPIGTANNISKTLGISGTPRQLIESWSSAGRKKFDVGVISSRWRNAWFLEAIGLGVFPQAISILNFIDDKVEADFDDRREKLLRDLNALKDILSRYSLQDVNVTLDGKDLSGRYMMAEAMNINFIGPNLYLAPGADPGDGYLDVVLVTDEERKELLDYLSARIEGKESPPSLTVHRGKTLEISWDGSQMHVDDKVWIADIDRNDVSPSSPVSIKIELQNQALEFLVPV